MTTYEDRRFYDLADLEGEEWKDVEGFEGFHQVSSMGRVKSLKRLVLRRWGFFKETKEKIMRLSPNDSGYLSVTLWNGKRFRYRVNRLVATHFIPNPENNPAVNHKKGIKADNRAAELEWVTHSENTKHAYSIGLITQKGEKNNGAKLTHEQVVEIRENYQGMMQKDIAKIYGVRPSAISRILSGKRWGHF